MKDSKEKCAKIKHIKTCAIWGRFFPMLQVWIKAFKEMNQSNIIEHNVEFEFEALIEGIPFF